MRWKLLAIALIAFASGSSASTEAEKWISRCGGPFQLCGYAERESGTLRIPQTFEVAKEFSEGLAAVRIDGRYGFIDPTGKIVIAPRFEAAGPFTGGYAEVRLDGASGAIDRSGKLVGSPVRGNRRRARRAGAVEQGGSAGPAQYRQGVK